MGLDISFHRAQALAAGLKMVKIQNGTQAEIDEAINKRGAADDYTQWLMRTEECVEVPNTGRCVADDGIGEHIIVRANKWGSTYYPLTQWLAANGIEWDEF